MISAIVAYLQDNGINAVRFSAGSQYSNPYICVKGENLTQGRGIRFIYHDATDKQNEIEDGLRNVCSLVRNHQFTSRNGCINQLGDMIDYADVAVVSDDNTISMEALFLMPTTTF